MKHLGPVLLVALLLVGCTRVIDDARPQMQRPVGPIGAAQVDDLLSPSAEPGNIQSPYFTVDPDDCAALAREVNPPLIVDARPAAQAGGFWYDDTGPEANVIELVGVYRSDYDANAAVAGAMRVIGSCRDRALKAAGEDGTVNEFRLRPPRDSGSPSIAIWSLASVDQWDCDNAFVAAHNAAVEITACAKTSGYDVLRLAKGALSRIEALAAMTA